MSCLGGYLATSTLTNVPSLCGCGTQPRTFAHKHHGLVLHIWPLAQHKLPLFVLRQRPKIQRQAGRGICVRKCWAVFHIRVMKVRKK